MIGEFERQRKLPFLWLFVKRWGKIILALCQVLG